MDVFTVAAEIFGDLKLTSGQLGQLRALEYRLLLDSAGAGGKRAVAGATAQDTADEPVAWRVRDASARAMISAEILEMLTPEQRAELNRR